MYRNCRLLVFCIAMACQSMIACWPSGDIYYQDQPQSHGDIYYDDQPVSYQTPDPEEHRKTGKDGVYITRKNDVIFRSNSDKFIEARNLSSKLAGVRGTFTHK